jgi:arsenate reductase
MTYTLLHNPKCSTSRNGLALLEESGVAFEIRAYTKEDQHLSVDELKEIAAKLGEDGPRAFLRAKDAKAAGITNETSDAALYKAMAENPKLIQRPIGIKGKKAIVGRPFTLLMDIV